MLGMRPASMAGDEPALPVQNGSIAAVSIEEVACDYGKNSVLQNVSLAVPPGKIMCLLGPSGCGKTTLLRIVAGLLEPSAGRIRLGGTVVADAATRHFVPPERRGLGMVFQDFALWPHLNVGGNVAFPLKMRGIPAGQMRSRVAAALERVGLGAFADRKVTNLSGGQQQRVAIARAIVAEPRIVLFDEPLSNLDRELRELLTGEIATLVRGLGLTAMYVTHDHAEAFALAHTVAVMQAGRIAQNAVPEILVQQPATPEVAEFLNLGPVVTAERTAEGWQVPGTDFHLGVDRARNVAHKFARVLLANNAFSLSEPATAAATGTVTQSSFRGDGYAVTVRVDAGPNPILARVRSSRRVDVGELVGLQIDAAQLRWFDSSPQKDASC
jgi:iron(III) transport system ATP-binding protein